MAGEDCNAESFGFQVNFVLTSARPSAPLIAIFHPRSPAPGLLDCALLRNLGWRRSRCWIVGV